MAGKKKSVYDQGERADNYAAAFGMRSKNLNKAGRYLSARTGSADLPNLDMAHKKLRGHEKLKRPQLERARKFLASRAGSEDNPALEEAYRRLAGHHERRPRKRAHS